MSSDVRRGRRFFSKGPERSRDLLSRRGAGDADRHNQEVGMRPRVRVHRRRGREGVFLPPYRSRLERELRLPGGRRARELRDRAEPEGPARESHQACVAELTFTGRSQWRPAFFFGFFFLTKGARTAASAERRVAPARRGPRAARAPRPWRRTSSRTRPRARGPGTRAERSLAAAGRPPGRRIHAEPTAGVRRSRP